MDTLLQDLRIAWRGLRRTPGFTLAAVATLALALGANTALFSTVHALLLAPMPFRDAGALVRVYCNQSADDDGSSPSQPEVAAWAAESGVFSDVAAMHSTSVNRTGGDLPERLRAVRTTPNLLAVLGVAPAAGRALEAGDAKEGAAPVALVSHALATRIFGTAQAAAGRTLTLDGALVQVAGVLPPRFSLGVSQREVDVWLPLALDTRIEAQGHHFLTVLARLAPGVTPEVARQAAARAATRVSLEAQAGAPPGELGGPHEARVRPWQADVMGPVRPMLLALWAAAGCVLLIACANVANLLLARAVHRRREGAIRSALGASRARRLREVLSESVLLSLLGGTVGVLLALWGSDALVLLLPRSVAQVADPGLTPPVLLFSFLLCLLAGVLSGVGPALESTRPSLLGLLGGGRGSTAGHHPLRAALVVVQLALAVVLLAGAGLAVRTLSAMADVALGFTTEGVAYAHLQLPQQRYPDAASRARAASRLEEAVGALPGVGAVGLLEAVHLGGSTRASDVGVNGAEARVVGEDRDASPGAFAALGVPLVRGRLFTAADGQGAERVALVNEAFVRAHLKGQEPLGARLDRGDGEVLTVVGVVGDVRHQELTDAPAPAFYRPVAQAAPQGFNLLVRGTPTPSLAQVRAAVQGVDPELPVSSLEPLSALVARSQERHTTLLQLLSALSAVALVLSALGIWGVVAYGVTQRLRELSIRRALGATERGLVALVVGGVVRLVALALLVGVPAAVALAQGARGLLYGVAPTDLPSLLGSALLLGLVGLLAAWLPARRAARVDPALALRGE
jgi:predicted permease